MRRIFFVTALLLSSTAAFAQSNPIFPEKGTREIGISSGSLSFRPKNVYNLTGTYAQFESAKLQVGGEVGVSRSDGGNRRTSLGIFANYHQPQGASMLRFAGLFLGNTDASGGGSGNAWGLQAGVKSFINSGAAITPQLVYRKSSKSGASETLSVEVGLRLFLR